MKMGTLCEKGKGVFQTVKERFPAFDGNRGMGAWELGWVCEQRLRVSSGLDTLIGTTARDKENGSF